MGNKWTHTLHKMTGSEWGIVLKEEDGWRMALTWHTYVQLRNGRRKHKKNSRTWVDFRYTYDVMWATHSHGNVCVCVWFYVPPNRFVVMFSMYWLIDPWNVWNCALFKVVNKNKNETTEINALHCGTKTLLLSSLTAFYAYEYVHIRCCRCCFRSLVRTGTLEWSRSKSVAFFGICVLGMPHSYR